MHSAFSAVRAKLSFVVVCAAFVCSSPFGVIFAKAADLPKPGHIIAKLRPSLSAEVEASASSAQMNVTTASSGNQRLKGFLKRHGLRSMNALYPGLVRLKKTHGLTDSQLAAAIEQKFPKRAGRMPKGHVIPEISRTYVVEVADSSDAGISKAITELQADPDVEYAEPDQICVATIIPNDPYLSSTGSWGQSYADLWGILKINGPTAWNIAAGDGIVVAVVDTGIDYNHTDIASNVWTNPDEIAGNSTDDDGDGLVDDTIGWDFIGSSYRSPKQSNDPIDHNGHGTHVAGTIAALGNNGVGVIGVAYRSHVMAIKGLDDLGYGLDSTLASAILYAANNGADVINLSWGGSGAASQTLSDAISYAYGLGIVVVAAAGNDEDFVMNHYPANLPTVIAVGASTTYDYPASFSNYGAKLDVLAPGTDILSLRAASTTLGTPLTSEYTRLDGTSMAAPHVAGLSALILSAHPDYSNEQVRQVIRAGGKQPYSTSGWDVMLGYGRIDAPWSVALPYALTVRITSLTDNDHITGLVTVSGSAEGNGFVQYTLDYGSSDQPYTWTPIQTSFTPVSGGVLGVLDTTGLTDGIYTIRLRATDSFGTKFYDQRVVIVDYVSITSPPLPSLPILAKEFKGGTPISIIGTASGATFQNYRIEWVRGILPSYGWLSRGTTLTSGGTSPVNNDVLGSVDTSGMTAGYYTIRVVVTNQSYESIATTLVYVEPELLSTYWPRWVDSINTGVSGMVPARRDDGIYELVFHNNSSLSTGYGSSFRTASYDGSILTSTPMGYASLLQPTVGRYGVRSGEERIVSEANDIRIFQPDGTSYTITPPVSVNLQCGQPILVDLDGDHVNELVARGQTSATKQAYLFAFRRDGSQLTSNFPISLGQNTDYFMGCNSGPIFAVADIDGDGKKEIVTAGSGSGSTAVVAFSWDGTPLQSWHPYTVPNSVGDLVLADLDQNGKMETIFSQVNANPAFIHVLQPDGTARPGWPVQVESGIQSLAVGDVGGDERFEIVAPVMSRLYVFNSDGSSFSSAWPKRETAYNTFDSAVLADLDGDGKQEIVTTRAAEKYWNLPQGASLPTPSADDFVFEIKTAFDPAQELIASTASISNPRADYYLTRYYYQSELVAYRSDGSVFRTWALLGANGNQPAPGFATPAIGDFDADGLTDIAVLYGTILGGGESGYISEGVATVLTTGAPYRPDRNDWPMAFHDPQNTNTIRAAKPQATLSVSALTFGDVRVGTSVTQSVTLTNGGLRELAISGMTTGDSFAMTSECPSSLAAGATCSIQFTFSPTTIGVQSGSFTLSSNSLGGEIQLSQSGTGIAPIIGIAPGSLTFGEQLRETTSSPMNMTVSNTGTAALNIASITATGDFAESTTCGSALNVGATCTVAVVFTPTAAGMRVGTLTISDDSYDGGTQTVSLSGTGLEFTPMATISAATVAFGDVRVGSTATRTLTLTNTGQGPLVISGISSGSSFPVTNDCPASLASNAMCTLVFTFSPKTMEGYSGTLILDSSSVAGQIQIPQSGSGIAPVSSVAPMSVTFPDQRQETTSSPVNVTVTNTGTATLNISSIEVTGDFAKTTNCGGTLAPSASCSVSVAFSPTLSGDRIGSLVISSDSYGGGTQRVSLNGTGVVPIATISPTALAFQEQLRGTTSSPLNVTITNTGTATLALSSIEITGDFAKTTNCGSTIAPSASCNVSVSFTPTASGSRVGSLVISSDSYGSGAHTVSLSGTGVAPIASISPSSIIFGEQLRDTTSSPTSITLTNTGTATLNISSIVVTGDFAKTTNCGSTVAPSASCNVSVSFTPTASGSRVGSLVISSDSYGSGAQTVSLTGTGVAPVASLSPAQIAFGEQLRDTMSSPAGITLTNTGTATLDISGITVTGDFAKTTNCGSTLAPTASCSVSVVFTPTASGSRVGSLVISSDSYGSGTQTVSLNGIGVAPVASISPTSVAFGDQRRGTSSAPANVILTNTGTATLNISGITATGDFARTTTCGNALAQGASCAISVVFTPTAAGNRAGSLTISTDSYGMGTQAISLSGNGVAPIATVAPVSITFGQQLVRTSSSPINVSITNTGTGPLSISSIVVNGDFARTTTCGSTLGQGATCAVAVVFTPTATGNRVGSLTISDDSYDGGSQTVSLRGTGTAPIATVSSNSVAFDQQLVQTSSLSTNVTITNSGTAPLSISSIVASGDFVQTTTCGSTLAPSANCTVAIVFTPTTAGSRTGWLTISDDSYNGATQTVSLSGAGLDYSLSATPASASISAGRSATYSIRVTPVGGSLGAVSFSCSGLPAASTCTFSPLQVTPGSAAASSTLTITTTKRTGRGGTPGGAYTVTVSGTTATSGAGTRRVPVGLTVY